MKNILNDKDYELIKNRIQSLTPASPRRWGKMDLAQMLVHCTMQLKLGLGEVNASAQGPAFMRSGLGKWVLLSNVPWPKGASTPMQMDVNHAQFPLVDVDTAKAELLGYLEKARREAQLRPHPFFGNLNQKQWSRLIYKHLDHHLKQFSN